MCVCAVAGVDVRGKKGGVGHFNPCNVVLNWRSIKLQCNIALSLARAHSRTLVCYSARCLANTNRYTLCAPQTSIQRRCTHLPSSSLPRLGLFSSPVALARLLNIIIILKMFCSKRLYERGTDEPD